MRVPIWFITLTVLYGSIHGRSVDDSRQSFIRSAIESNPWEEDKYEVSVKQDYRTLLTSIGSESQPLRTAIEDVPFIPFISRVPLRDAVEFRPASSQNYRVHDDEEFEYHRRARQSFAINPFAAYIMSSTEANYARDPPPYRADSPFQQIVDKQSYVDLKVKLMDDPSLIDEIIYSDDYHIENQQHEDLKKSKDDYVVFCHMTNWAFYREGKGKFAPENLDPKLCSHILYSFATLDPQSLEMKEFDPWGDIENELYKRTINLDQDVPVLISLGGWTDSTGDKYSKMVANPSARKNFISKAVQFLKQYGFAGLHFDWNYPVCWQSDCKKGPAKDKNNFAKFIEELSDEFYQEDFLLSVALSGYKEVIQDAYDLPRLSEAADFLVVMTYDYHGAWEQETGHIAPLYPRSTDKYPQYNIDYTLNMLIKGGVDKSKLIMGVPFYGQTFTLTNSYNSVKGEGTPAGGTGHAGMITKQPGMLAYYEICSNVKSSRWMTGSDSSGKSGPYAMKGDQWVSYDDPKYLTTKSQYVMKNGLAGIAAWTVDFDDYHNDCCQGQYPLLKAINRALGRVMTPAVTNDCSKPPEPVTPVAPVMTPPPETGEWRPPSTQNVQSTTWPSWSQKPTTTTPKRTTSTTTTKRTTTTTTTTTPKPTTTRKKTTTRAPVTTSSTTTRRTTRAPSTTHKPTQTTSGSTSSDPAIPPPAVVAPSGSQGEPCDNSMDYSSDPSNCNAYYRCVSGTLVKAYCPGGLHWRPDMKLCDWPANAKCTESAPPSVSEDEEIEEEAEEPSTTTTKRPPRPSRPAKPSKRPTKPSKPSTLADPEVTTTSKRTTRKTTTTTTTTTKAPTTPSTTRRTTTRRSTTVASPSTSKPSKPTKRKCEAGNRYPHKDCSKFYVCINGKKVAQSCPPDYQWSQKMQMCDVKENVRCVSKLKLISLKDADDVDEASCTDEDYPQLGESCTTYLLCVHGQIIERDCPNGLEWNDGQKSCDWPANANCDINSKPEFDGTNNEVARPTRPPTTTTTSTPRPVYSPFSGDYKLVCYYTNWSWYRRGLGKYVPENIDTDLCTHVVYGFAVLDTTKLTIRTHDSWADLDNNFYTRVTELKNKGVKVSLALGGWNDSLGDKYSRLVRSAEARARFVTQSMEFMEKFGFEGLDLDWEYPVCWQVDCKKGFPDEKEGFTALVRELSEAFKPKGYLLSAAVSPNKKVIDAGYDVPAISEYFDWIAVMCYDYHGQWDKKTGHNAPFYYHPEDEIDHFNANFTMMYWLELGAPADKLVMGMPLYGQSFQLENKANNGLNARAPGPGSAGEFTRAAGFLSYYEICDRIKNKGWTVVRDPQGRIGPYAYHGNQWVSFDDKDSLRRKSHYIRKHGFAGGMIWALDLDDFKNRCGEGHYPLLRTIRDVLAQPKGSHEEIPEPSIEENEIEQDEYEDEVQPVTPSTTTTTTTKKTRTTRKKKKKTTTTTSTTTTARSTTVAQDEYEEEPEREEDHLETFDETAEVTGGDTSEVDVFGDDDDDEEGVDENLDFKVICYFTNWAWYRQEGGKYLPEDIDTELCTHIIYGFAVLDRDSLTIKTHDSWADLDNEFYSRVVAHKQKGAKVSVAIGGWNDSAGDKYSRLVRDPAARARFIRHVMSFIERHEFDGLDLDWEYPVCWQVDCKKGYEDEKEGFTALVKELSEEFKPKGYLLSTAVSPNKKVIDAGYEVEEISKYFDWIAVMTYDYHGQWDKKTGHGSPMYEHPDDFEKTFNTNFTMNYWIEQGAPRRKLVMGIPMYGQSFSLADNKNNGLNAQTYGGGEAGPATRSRGFLSYFEICRNIREKNWKVVRDLQGRMGPYAYLRDQWVSFDDIPMVQHKSEYIKAMGLGGAMIWALDLDDFRNVCDCEEYPLLKTINRALRNYPQRNEQCTLEPVRQANKPVYDDEKPVKPTKKPNKKPSRKPTTITITGSTLSDEMTTAKPTPTKRTTRRKKTRTTPKTTTTSTTKEPAMDYELIENDDHVEEQDQVQVAPPDGCETQFKPHESDCSMYYMCNYGIWNEQICPSGLHWNTANYCDWPLSAGCQYADEQRPSTTSTKRPKTKTTRRTTTVAVHDDVEGQYDDDENAVDDSTFSSTTTTMRSTTRKRRKKTKTTTTTTTVAPVDDESNEIEHDDEEPEKPSTTKKPVTTRKPSRKPSRKPTKPPADPVVSDGEFKVVCYFTNWAWYRPGAGKYLPDDIDTDLCTHIVYGFAVLDRETLTIRTHDSWADIDNKFYTRVSDLKNKGVKVTLALGGWNDSLGDKYSKLVRDPNARRRFVNHALEFVEKYGFEGLDLDWEYPVCWQVDCKKGFADEKEGFAALVEELAVAFRPRGLLLSSAVSPSKMVIDAAYDVPSLAVNFDWIAVMTYDYHGQWDKKTGHVAPLYEHPEDENKYFNGNFTMHYWIEKGCPPSKLVMGVPMYGQSFGLADQSQHGLNAKSYGAGEAGQFTRAGGFLSFYEICSKINGGGWNVVKDPEGRMGPYAYKGTQWVSYDDIEDVKRKTQYMRDMKLGGGMIWALDLDDFRGTCGCGKYPLLKMLNAGLGRGITSRTTDCT